MPPMGRLTDIPLDLAAFLCQCLHPEDVLRLQLVSKGACAMAQQQEVWRFFCHLRWGREANLQLYSHAKTCFRDKNGWFPHTGRGRSAPCFEVLHVKAHQSKGCLTMDMRITAQEVVTVSESPWKVGSQGSAWMRILDPANLKVRAEVPVSQASINCCDVANGMVCTADDTGKVRLYSLRSKASPCLMVQEVGCSEAVNDVRIARDGRVIALKTVRGGVPAGMDIIDPERAAVTQLAGGGRMSHGKFLHNIDGFEGGCSLSQVASCGEEAITCDFSAMLFDFRRGDPCVLDVPVAADGTLLWPLRAGRFPQVYVNLRRNDQPSKTIQMVDFRYPSELLPAMYCNLPSAVDDFHYLDGNLYALCTDHSLQTERAKLHRFNPEAGITECLCTVVEAYDAHGWHRRNDMKVLATYHGGFAVAHGQELWVGTLACQDGRV
mmetsp:Transcript_65620/g.154353  ORF Transcript_65620/g.154353 Transcript_65620/m.154353 type:complete len:436 (-) Transcript_65620:187-1494(-)